MIFNLYFRKQSLSKHHEEPSIDLIQSLIECQEINQLFFQNHLNEGLQKTKALYIVTINLIFSQTYSFIDLLE